MSTWDAVKTNRGAIRSRIASRLLGGRPAWVNAFIAAGVGLILAVVITASLRPQLVVEAAVALGALLVAGGLPVYKPPGRAAYRMRRQGGVRAVRAVAPGARPSGGAPAR